MWQQILALLLSKKRADRIQGWNQLHADYTMSQRPVSPEQRELLSSLLMDELTKDDGVWQMGMTAMSGLPSTTAAQPPAQSTPSETQHKTSKDDSLAAWLWHPFKSNSAIYGLVDRHHRRRDELSLMYMSNQICRHRYPNTRWHLMYDGEPRSEHLLFGKRYECMCFVGRLGIFGDEAVKRWGNKDCQFGFLMHKRPSNLALGKLHKKYHCITERLPDGKLEYHQSADRNRQRLDFGVVQRYVVRNGARRIVVVTCAGGSALGTLAATIWAINELEEPLGPDGQPIGLPPSLNVESRLEVLVQVTADNTGFPWHPKQIELQRLYAGRHVWSDDDRSWKPLTNTHITLFTDGNNVTHIKIDGKDVQMQPGAQGFNLFVRICEGVMKRRDGVVDLNRLARDQDLWSGKTVSEQHVRRRLSGLKHRTLHECLTIDKAAVTLTAEVEMIRD